MAMNKVMEEGNVIKVWKISGTVMVPKRKKHEPKDHIHIALTNVRYKIFMSLVKGKIVEHIRQVEQESEFQFGFTGGRRLRNNLFILRYGI